MAHPLAWLAPALFVGSRLIYSWVQGQKRNNPSGTLRETFSISGAGGSAWSCPHCGSSRTAAIPQDSTDRRPVCPDCGHAFGAGING